MDERINPVFKYNPNAFSIGLIRKQNSVCPSCMKPTPLVYDGPFISDEIVEGICPWCISDGTAARKYNGFFQNSSACEKVDQDEYVEELTKRTPGYTAFQQESWLSHCGDFCAFVDYAIWSEVDLMQNELMTDLEQISNKLNCSIKELIESLKANQMQGYLFQCLHCGLHRIVIDME